jgi:hypothetical protein
MHRWGLVTFWHLLWFRMDRGLSFLPRRCFERLDLGLTSSRHRALGLLHRSTFKKPAELVADLSPLCGGWHWHCSEEDCHRSDILTSPSEGSGLFAPFVVTDASVNIASPALGCPAVSPAGVLPLEGGPEVHQLSVVLFDLSLEFVELLELSSLRPLRGGCHGPPPRGPYGKHLLMRSMGALFYKGGIPRRYLLDLHMKAFV